MKIIADCAVAVDPFEFKNNYQNARAQSRKLLKNTGAAVTHWLYAQTGGNEVPCFAWRVECDEAVLSLLRIVCYKVFCVPSNSNINTTEQRDCSI